MSSSKGGDGEDEGLDVFCESLKLTLFFSSNKRVSDSCSVMGGEVSKDVVMEVSRSEFKEVS